MGCEGNVDIYEYDRVAAYYLKKHGKPIEEDWPYIKNNCHITLKGKKYLVVYYNQEGTNSVDMAYLAEDKVQRVLDEVAMEATTEVWT